MRRPLTRALALGLGLLVGLAAPRPARAEDPWYEIYQDALKSIQSRKWADAEKRLKAAMASGPRPGRQVRTYGVRSIDYLPEYQLGLVYFNERNYPDALEQFAKVQASGLVSKGDAEYETLQDMLQLVRIRVSPAPTEDKGDANLVAVGRDLMTKGNLPEARRVLEAARDKYPQSALVLTALLDLGRLEADHQRSTPTPPVATTMPPPPTTLVAHASPSPSPTPAAVPASEARVAFEAFYSGRYDEAAAAFGRVAVAAPASRRPRYRAYQAASAAATALLRGDEAGITEAARVFRESGASGARALAADALVSPAVRRALQP